MPFFKKPILTKERIKALKNFRKGAIKALKHLQAKAEDDISKEIYRRMIENVKGTPVFFYPRKNMRENVFRAGNLVFASVVKGEHVNVLSVIQMGSQKFVVKSDYINMPAEHVFEGNRLSMQGIFTLAHEYAHFPKPALHLFAKRNRISFEQAEELLADTLSAKLAVEMGYPKELVLNHFEGRQLVYGRIPFKRFIWNAVNK
ncbi:MAG: hypothetical protein JW744_01360 [Candidatus Diapherotrites archaeon]|uniref:Uncharacterized protein n=1 Tax=Candidatus Iainarchaeum sp. TaxID=3101447 RepID=A0A938YTY2_9ARCH|nr:hypothetical protein [Candidatus Diapherotrites archaeon]